MTKASLAQTKILDRLRAGAQLALDTKTGRYAITEIGGKVCQIDQRPIIVMVRDGLLHQDLGGRCIPVDQLPEAA